MGGDLLASESALPGDKMNMRGSKILNQDGMLIGFSGSVRVGNILQYMYKPDSFHPDKDEPMEYLVQQWIEGLRSALKIGGVAAGGRSVGEQDWMDSGILVALHGLLFAIQDDFSVIPIKEHYHATGCGYYLAMGALYAQRNLVPDKSVVKEALSAAAHFNPFCGPNFTFLSKAYKA